jgi:hypothetical protein
MGQVSAVATRQVEAINEGSDEHSLVLSTPYDPTSSLTDLNTIYLPEEGHTSPRPGIFSVWGQVCLTPKVETKRDPVTGKYKTIPSLRYSQHH